MRIVAIIPAKGYSTRVPEKNFRPFADGLSLVDIKIQQCMDSGIFDAIYVTSDVEQGRIAAESHEVRFLQRDPRLCLNETPWSDVVTGVLHQLPEEDDVWVAWCLPTSPLFARYDEAVRVLREQSDYDSLTTVTKQQHYFLGPDLLPLNFQFGVWLSSSQRIRPLYHVNCALWLAPKNLMLANRFQIGDRPFFMETSMIDGIDIDTLEEFELAQLLYAKRFSHAIGASS